MQDRELQYAFVHKIKNVLSQDSSLNVFSSVDDARAKILFDNFDFSLGTQTWSLAEGGTALVLTWIFTDANANDQLTVHNAIKNEIWTTSCTPEEDSSVGWVERKDSLGHYRAWGQYQT